MTLWESIKNFFSNFKSISMWEIQLELEKIREKESKIADGESGKRGTSMTQGKPRKLNQSDIGKRFIREGIDEVFEIQGVNSEYVLVKSERKESALFNMDWLPYEEPTPPKKKVMMAPALVRVYGNEIGFSTCLYRSEEEARKAMTEIIRWPASPNLMIEVEVEE